MLELMSRLLGAPNERIWPGLSAMPHAARFSLPPQPYNYLRKVGARSGSAKCVRELASCRCRHTTAGKGVQACAAHAPLDLGLVT